MSMLASNKTLAAEIYRELKLRIVGCQGDAQWSPGEPLRTDKLAREFGVSHTPIRESLRLLERDGLVSHLPRRGVVVRDINQREFVEMFDVRRALEPVTAANAARHASPQQCAQMRQLLMEAGESAHREDRLKLVRLDQDFHRLIAQSCGNSVLAEVTQSLLDRFQMFFARTITTSPTPAVFGGQDEHMKILEAIQARDPEQASARMMEHIRGSQRRAVEQGLIASAGGSEV